MIPEQIVASLLLAASDVTAITTSGRIYPGMLPEGKPVPAVVFRRIDAMVLHRPLSVTGASTQIVRARMRLFAVTKFEDYVVEKTLMQATRIAVGNKVGTIAGFNNVHIGSPMVSPEMPEPVEGLQVSANDFYVTYHEPI